MFIRIIYKDNIFEGMRNLTGRKGWAKLKIRLKLASQGLNNRP